MNREYRHCAVCDPGPWREAQKPLEMLHVDGACMVCRAKALDQERIERELAKRKTSAKRIEFMLREVHTQKYLDRDGRWRHTDANGKSQPGANIPAIPRGRNAKNIARVLARGKQKGEQLRTGGGILRRKQDPRKQARWSAKEARRRGVIEDLQYSPRGARGRVVASEKATTTRRGFSRQAQARVLRDQGLTERQIAASLGVTDRQIRRYLTGR